MLRLSLLSAFARGAYGMTTATRPKLAMRTLGSSNLEVTEACLGTMTWGVQNSEEEAHAQLDYAVKECGVNFIDTAELYPAKIAPAYHVAVTHGVRPARRAFAHAVAVVVSSR